MQNGGSAPHFRWFGELAAAIAGSFVERKLGQEQQSP
jgi:hypothetical protein